jgi:hypothetical protein
MLHPQLSLSQLWDVWEVVLLLARPRGPQAMYRAIMPSQWLTLMLSQGYAIFQPQSCFISLHMLHPQMSLSQLWDV